jgi:hypothetical protein
MRQRLPLRLVRLQHLHRLWPRLRLLPLKPSKLLKQASLLGLIVCLKACLAQASQWLQRLCLQQLTVKNVAVVLMVAATPNAVSNATHAASVLSALKAQASAVMAVVATRAVAVVASVRVNVVPSARLSAVTNLVLIRATKHAPSLGMSLVLRVAQKAAAHVQTVATRAMKHV